MNYGMDKATSFEVDQGEKVIGRMTSGAGYKVELLEVWNETYRFFEVLIDGRKVHMTEDRANAVRVGHWWLDGCLA